MTIDEVTDYFKHGACSKVSNVSTVSADYGGSYIDCKMAGRTVNIVYYSDHPENVVKDFKLKNTGKRFVIDMPDFDYRWVKAAL